MAREGIWPSLFFVFFFFFFFSVGVRGQGGEANEDMAILRQAKSILGSSENVILSSWNSTTDPCSWRNVQWVLTNGTSLNCSSAVANNQTGLMRVGGISLAAAGLNGSIPSELAKLTHLKTLDLGFNSLSGTIPSELGNAALLSILRLGHNSLNGAFPISLWNLCSQLSELELGHNNLSGSIPSPASPTPAACPSLAKLDLSNNSFSGDIPVFLANFSSLATLDLSDNGFEGAIPGELSALTKLVSVDMSNNNLSGPIPGFTLSLNPTSFANNSLLCGPPLSNPCSTNRLLSPNAVAALVICFLSVAVILLALSVGFGYKHNWGRKVSEEVADLRRELREEDIGDGKLFRFEGGEHLGVEEVLNAPGEVMGKTSYGAVYKAKLHNGGMFALRLLREDTVTDREGFASAIQELGLIRHPNLVSTLAYYAGAKGERLLVYNYLSRGSLSDLLHDRNPLGPSLGWARRHKIVLAAARGLSYLHHNPHKHLMHGNIKSTNILVDENYEGHVADYGLYKLMSPAAHEDMLASAETQGYKAPELKKMKRVSVKSDIYAFGIVLLEVLTGKKPREEGEDDKEVDLPTMVKTAVLEERTAELFDLELVAGGARVSVEEGLVLTLRLAMGCCAPSPSARPDIKEVVHRLEEIRPKIPTPLYTPTGMKSPKEFVLH